MRERVFILSIIAAGMLAQAGERPNVVFILSDDQSWGDYGFMGHPHLQTPHLDQLAGEGLVYERGYTTAAICRPSLASIATGLYPHQTAVRGNGPFMGEDVDHKRIRKDKKLLPLAREQSKAMTATLAHAPSMVKRKPSDWEVVGGAWSGGCRRKLAVARVRGSSKLLGYVFGLFLQRGPRKNLDRVYFRNVWIHGDHPTESSPVADGIF